MGLSPARADTNRITATIAITNAPTTNGMTITIAAGNTTVRTWTNSVSIASSQILTNSSAAGSATNLYNQLIASAPLGVAPIVMSSATNIILYGQSGVNLAVTFSVPSGPGYASVTYATQAVTTAVNVRVPFSIEAAAQRTNIASAVTLIINATENTNQVAQSAPAAAQLLGTTNAQTITGIKTFTKTNVMTGLIASNLVATSNAILNNLTSTNGRNYGNAFRSPGAGIQSEQFGYLATATNDSSTALGYGATAWGIAATAIGSLSQGTADYTTALGAGAEASATSALALGNSSVASATNAIALGQSAEASWNDSVAIGTGAIATKTNQVYLGRSIDVVTIPGSLEHLKTTGTNSFSDIAFRRYAITSLANGNNAGVIIGTNSFVEVSGPSAAFTINGMTGSPARDGHLVVIVNQTGFDMTVAHQSGTDPVAANRIITMTGADRSTTGNGAATFLYSAAASRWLLIAFDP